MNSFINLMQKRATQSVAAWSTLFLVAAALFVPSISSAQEEEGRFANIETKKVKAISPDLAKKLTPVRDLLAPEVAEGQEPPPPDAAGALRGLNRIKLNDYESHEKAEVYNLYGFVYYLQENIPKALEYYERVVNEPEANSSLQNRTLRTVAQLCMIEEKWDCALSRLKEWMSLQATVGPKDFAILSTIYYSKDDLTNALINIEKALEIRESTGKLGEEQWYAVQRSIYYQRKDYRRVITILKTLIVNFPKVRYWSELGGMYGELEDSKNQMNAFVLTYLQGGLTTESQILGMAYMYIGADAPYKGAEIIVDGFEAGTVEKTEKTLQLVGSAYYEAYELEKALPYMEQAAQKATGGDPYGLLAGIYLDLGRFEESIRTANEALRRGNLKQSHIVRLALGNAYFNEKKYDQSLKAFRQIREGQDGYKSAQQWIKYVDSERRREQQLRDSGIDLDKILG